MIYSTKCECKNCKERYVGCHGTCEKYLSFKKNLEIEKQKLNSSQEKINDSYSKEVCDRYRMKKYRKRHLI
jgi:hypothetical protein